MSNDLRKFFLKIFLLLIPIAVFLAFPLYVLLAAKEMVSIEDMILEHASHGADGLIGFGYRNPVRYMKFKSLIIKKPAVLALGTSRSMQFRDFFFNAPKKFYNAGGAIEQIKHFSYFLRRIPDDALPRILLLVLDQNMFNEKWRGINHPGEEENFLAYNNSRAIFAAYYKEIYKDYFVRKKFSLGGMRSKNKACFGINAVINDKGFRPDGSYNYGDIAEHKKNDNVFFRILAGNNAFEYGEDVSGSALKELDNFLKEAKNRGVYVIGLLPPFAPEVLKKMAEVGKHQYISKLPGELAPIFTAYKFRFYDFTDVAEAGDSEFIDGFHGSEKVYLRLYLKILKKESILKKYSDYARLADILKNSNGDYLIFPEKRQICQNHGKQ